MGIEPTLRAWEAPVLPLNYTRKVLIFMTKTIRSYVLRQGRLTPAQARALDECWPIYGIDLAQPLELKTPTVLEIGFGMGQSLLIQAQLNRNIKNNGWDLDIKNPNKPDEENQLSSVELMDKIIEMFNRGKELVDHIRSSI